MDTLDKTLGDITTYSSSFWVLFVWGLGGGRECEGVEAQLTRVSSSLHHVDPQSQAKATRVSSECLYSQHHLASPALSFKLRIISQISICIFRLLSPMGKQSLA